MLFRSIVTGGTTATVALQREKRTIPIVFANVTDPVVQRIVPRLNQPGGNITGFALYEPALPGKWLELLSEIAPGRQDHRSAGDHRCRHLDARSKTVFDLGKRLLEQ